MKFALIDCRREGIDIGETYSLNDSGDIRAFLGFSLRVHLCSPAFRAKKNPRLAVRVLFSAYA